MKLLACWPGVEVASTNSQYGANLAVGSCSLSCSRGYIKNKTQAKQQAECLQGFTVHQIGSLASIQPSLYYISIEMSINSLNNSCSLFKLKDLNTMPTRQQELDPQSSSSVESSAGPMKPATKRQPKSRPILIITFLKR